MRHNKLLQLRKLSHSAIRIKNRECRTILRGPIASAAHSLRNVLFRPHFAAVI